MVKGHMYLTSRYILFLLLSCLPVLLFANEEEGDQDMESANNADVLAAQSRRYRSPEERRKAGLSTKVTDWLAVSGLFEMEKEYLKTRYVGGTATSESEPSMQTLQLGANVQIMEGIEIELVYEIEHEREYKILLDEGLLAIDIGEWGIKVGKLYPPFAEFYSHFITGPLIEFAEVRKISLITDYSFNDTAELSLFLCESDSDKINAKQSVDWGAGFEFKSEDESMQLGVGYLSDLAETIDPLLDDKNYTEKVAAWSVYLLLGLQDYEFTAEMIHAIGEFAELDSDANKPVAYNLELAWLPHKNLQLAVRYERSKELGDEPKKRYGISTSWFVSKRLSLSIDYLHDVYKSGFVFNDSGEELERRWALAGRVSFEF